jgi:hypothetical protein
MGLKMIFTAEVYQKIAVSLIFFYLIGPKVPAGAFGRFEAFIILFYQTPDIFKPPVRPAKY